MPQSLIALVFGVVLFRIGRFIDQLPRPIFSQTGQMSIDAVLSLASIWLAYQLRFDFDVPLHFRAALWFWVLVLPFLRPLCLWILGVYAGIWRYFNLGDTLVLMLGAAPPAALMLLLRIGWAKTHWTATIPVTTIVVDFGVFLLFTLGARGSRRLLYEASRRNGQRKRTLVIGTEEGLASALRQVSLFPDIAVMGLLTSDVCLHGHQIAGFNVVDTPTGLAPRLTAGTVDLILIADADVDCIGKTVATAIEFGVEVRLLPSAAHIIRGDVRVSTTPKPELAINHAVDLGTPHQAVIDTFRGRAVLITGAGGSIGSEISRQVARLPVSRLLLLDQDENSIFEITGELEGRTKVNLVPLVGDIRDRDGIWSIFSRHKPQIVLHAAAYKHVPVMEHNCAEAVLNNVVGTRMVAEAAVTFGAERFLMISTDKAVNPSSMMGATKRMAELLVQHLAARQNGNGKITRCACVRFGNVMGSRGSVVPLFLRQIASGGPLTITHADMTRYFMTIPEAVQLVLEAAALGSNGEIYMLDMGDPVKITTLARRLIEMSGLRPDEDIEIRFVGTRPGEKLHEQLWIDANKVTPTAFPRVLTVKPPPPLAGFETRLEALEAAALTRNDELTRRMMKEMPINYKEMKSIKAAVAGSLSRFQPSGTRQDQTFSFPMPSEGPAASVMLPLGNITMGAPDGD